MSIEGRVTRSILLGFEGSFRLLRRVIVMVSVAAMRLVGSISVDRVWVRFKIR